MSEKATNSTDETYLKRVIFFDSTKIEYTVDDNDLNMLINSYGSDNRGNYLFWFALAIPSIINTLIELSSVIYKKSPTWSFLINISFGIAGIIGGIIFFIINQKDKVSKKNIENKIKNRKSQLTNIQQKPTSSQNSSLFKVTQPNT
ncbi:MAG: hypothetical protein FDX30_09050 [Chlorobium sp.]|nr:MAG: hypothetical protein FDX30_09050 [Chlorobium sp.]